VVKTFLKYVSGLFVLFLFCSPAFAQQGTFRLGLNLEEGGTFRQIIKSEQKIKQKVFGMEQDISQDITLGLRFAVGEVDHNRHAHVQVTFEQFVVKINGLAEPLEFDSGRPQSASPALRGFSNVAGSSFDLVLTATAQIVSVSGIGEIFGRATAGMNTGGGQFEQLLLSGMSSQLNDKTVAGILENMFAIYPLKPVRRGDSWTKKTNFNTGIRASAVSVYTLKSVSGSTAEIDVVTTIAPESGAAGDGNNDAGIVFDMSGNGRGSLRVNIPSGWIAGGTLRQHIEGTLRVAGLDSRQFSMPLSIDQTVTYSSR